MHSSLQQDAVVAGEQVAREAPRLKYQTASPWQCACCQYCRQPHRHSARGHRCVAAADARERHIERCFVEKECMKWKLGA